jgi:hypothetical protein
MKRMILCFMLVALIMIIVGCGADSANLRRATGSKLGVHPDAVAISNTDIGMTEYRWTAEVGGKKYNCFADDRMRDVSCIPAQKK